MQILYKYERNWSKAAQNNRLWVLIKLAYTQISLQYFGALPLKLAKVCQRDWLVISTTHARAWTPASKRSWRMTRYVSSCNEACRECWRVCTGAAFMTLFWKESLAVWRSMHFLGHFMVAAVLLGEICSNLTLRQCRDSRLGCSAESLALDA